MKPSSHWPRRGLYLITPDEPDTGRLMARLAPAIAAGPALLQYRNKLASPALRREQIGEILPLCRVAGLPLLVNDHWELALELGADGAHLGADDGSLAQARAALGPGAILGASCYNELPRAVDAAAQGASYVAFGAFFPSGTKPLARRATPDLLAAAGFGLPRVAIGGITPDNGASLVAAGADLLAVIAGVFDSPDPAAAVRAYRRCFEPLSLEPPHP